MRPPRSISERASRSIMGEATRTKFARERACVRRIGRELRKGRRRKRKRGREERRCAQTDGGKGARREKTKLECGMRTSQCERAHRVRGHISIRIRRVGAKVSMQYLGLKSRRAQQVQLGDRTQYSVLSTQPRECRSRGSHTVRTPVTATSPGLRPALRHHRSLGVSWVWIHAHRAEVTRCIRDIPARTIKTIPAMYPIREQATQPTRVQLNAHTRQRRIHPGATKKAMALPN